MEQQAEEEAASEGEEATDEESSESPQPTEGEAADGDADGDADGEMMPMEGMSISEAQDLLDSLRGSEQLLPFSDPSDETRQSNRNRELRDW